MLEAKKVKCGIESGNDDLGAGDRDSDSSGAPLNYFHHEVVAGWLGGEEEEEDGDDQPGQREVLDGPLQRHTCGSRPFACEA